MWGTQLAGTAAVAIAIYLFFGDRGAVFANVDPEWTRYGLYGILGASVPALMYVRRFKRSLNADIAAANAGRGEPDPRLRAELMRKLHIGGALCELPLALGALYLLAGGERRWFIAGACVSLALRLSYRPFTAASRR
ncbi:MAG: hypothetical protein ACXWGT_02780 [Usitatibacter sp.]